MKFSIRCMRILLIMFAVIGLATAFFVIRKNDKKMCGISIISDQKAGEMLNGLTEEPFDFTQHELLYNGSVLSYAKNKKAYYVPTNYISEDFSGELSIAGYSLFHIADDYSFKKAETLKDGIIFRTIAVNDESKAYFCFDLYFSGLPLVYINSDKGINKEYTKADIEYFDMGLYSVKQHKEAFIADVKISASGETYSIKTDDDVLMLAETTAKKYKLYKVSPEDKTGIRQYMASKMWNRINSKDALNQNYQFAEVIADGTYKGLYLVTEKVEELADSFDNWTQIDADNLADYVLFIQSTYALKNLSEDYAVVAKAGADFIIPERVEYSFGMLPRSIGYYGYGSDSKAIFSEGEFDKITPFYSAIDFDKVKDKYIQYRKNNLNIDGIYEDLSGARNLLLNSGYAVRNGMYVFDEEANDFTLDTEVALLKKYITNRFAFLDNYYLGKTDIDIVNEEFDTTDISFIVDGNEKDEMVSLFVEDEDAYLFLSSATDSSHATINFDQSKYSVSIQGKEVNNGSDILLADDMNISIEYDNQKYDYCLKVKKSENLPSVYVDTYTGSTEYIDSKKKNKEPATLVCFDEKGRKDSEGVLVKIQSRGASSFDLTDKKSYKLVFEQPTDVLKMGEATEYLLINNALEPTKLRNTVVDNISQLLKMSPRLGKTHIDLYINGVYEGNYLLCEKIEVAENRIESQDGIEYLFEMNGIDTVDEDSKFVYGKNAKDYGKVAMVYEIKYPDNIEDEEVAAVQNYLSDIEKQILECDNSDKYQELKKVIDTDSFASMYILDFITNEVDANNRSTFYWVSNGIIHAGPEWDYDRAFGNEVRRGLYPEFSGYFGGLCEDLYYSSEDFRVEVATKFNTIKPDLYALSSKGIKQTYEFMKGSLDMEHTRWPEKMHEKFVDYEDSQKNLEYFIQCYNKRLTLFDLEINNPEKYCNVYINGHYGRKCSIERGTSISQELIDYICDLYKCETLSDENGNVIDSKYIFNKDSVIYSDIKDNGK